MRQCVAIGVQLLDGIVQLPLPRFRRLPQRSQSRIRGRLLAVWRLRRHDVLLCPLQFGESFVDLPPLLRQFLQLLRQACFPFAMSGRLPGEILLAPCDLLVPSCKLLFALRDEFVQLRELLFAVCSVHLPASKIPVSFAGIRLSLGELLFALRELAVPLSEFLFASRGLLITLRKQFFPPHQFASLIGELPFPPVELLFAPSQCLPAFRVLAIELRLLLLAQHAFLLPERPLFIPLCHRVLTGSQFRFALGDLSMAV
jgi:hypothetical protein